MIIFYPADDTTLVCGDEPVCFSDHYYVFQDNYLVLYLDNYSCEFPTIYSNSCVVTWWRSGVRVIDKEETEQVT